MESFRVSINAVLPLFLYMTAGYIAKLCGLLDEKDIFKFNKVIFNVCLTTNMFRAVYNSELNTAVRPMLIAYTVVGVLLAYGIGLALAKIFSKQRNQRGVMVQGIFRSNFVLIGLAIAGVLVPNESTAPVAILSAIVIPLYNVLAVIVLSVYGGEKIRSGEILIKILKNPLIISTAMGILCLTLNIRFPEAVETAINGLSAVATPMMLFLLGAFFHFDSLKNNIKQLAVVAFFKLIGIPGIFLTLGYALGFRQMEFAGLMAAFSSSTAVSSFTMSQQLGGDAELAGDIIVITAVLSSFTLFGWCMLFKTIGAF
ncbi:MAG: AEC family transporter [Oscillospiraceae bacterium]|nr:AEC family transporter [Oscillospiraceae bacterium]